MTDNIVLTQQFDQLAILSLNRPKALNAINPKLNKTIYAILEQWRDDNNIQAILINSSTERAFCSGGDIRLIYEDVKANNYVKGQEVFYRNYRLIYYVANYPKPIICLMNGITMGGGLGLGAVCHYRVVTDHSILAMPEVKIGLTPDAGCSRIFCAAPGFSGLRYMLTGHKFNAEEAIRLGFADYLIPSSEINLTIDSLKKQPIDAVLKPFHKSLQFDKKFLEEINQIYKASSVEEIISRLKVSNYPWAIEDVQVIEAASPLSVQISFDAWHKKPTKLRNTLQQEYNLVCHQLRHPDFAEGVRAAVIDKDKNPHWDQKPISKAEIKSFFDQNFLLFSE